MSSTPSNSPNPYTEPSNPSEHEDPHSQSQTLETLNPPTPENLSPTTHSLIPQNQEHPEANLDEQVQENLDHNASSGTADSSSFPHPALSVVVPPMAGTCVSVPEPPPLMSPTNTLRRNKRKKGKCNTKKLLAIEKRLQTLKEKLNPIPFLPSKILDFARHEKLLRRLGLWDFVHIEFDQDIRVDLIAQLVATYDAKMRCSYVNDFRIAVNRADLARALKLPVKKDKGSVAVVDGMDLDDDPLSDESIVFIEDFVSIWVLLHEDTWMMPNEVLNWTKAVKDGHPEKVDWAGLFWFMVEKELTQGEHLVDCYYSAHLQYLIKSQREQVLFSGEPEKVEFEVEVKEEDDYGNEDDARVLVSSQAQEEGGALEEGLNMELTLGQEIGLKQEVKDVEEVHVEEHKEEEEQRQWLFDEKTDANEPFLQRCKMKEAVALDNEEEKNEENELVDNDDEEEEEEAIRHEVEDGFDVMASDDTLVGDGLTGNLLQAMEGTQIAFSPEGQLHDQSSVELHASRAEMHTAGPFFGIRSKREIELEHDMAHHSLNDSNKRARIEGAWDQKPLDFGSCMDQMQQLMTRARIYYEEKEQNVEQLNMSQQLFLNEVHKRDTVIDHLHKTKYEEVQKKDGEIYRLERELFIMGNILDGYRKAMKETQKEFSDYRSKCQLPEEPYYKDAGPGGLMLSTAEIEKLRLKQEEENRSNCLILEQQSKEAMEGLYVKVQMLDNKLMNLEYKVKDLRDFNVKRTVTRSEEKLSETPNCSPDE